MGVYLYKGCGESVIDRCSNSVIDEGCGEGVTDERCGKGVIDEGCGEGVTDERCGKGVIDEGCGETACCCLRCTCTLVDLCAVCLWMS